MPDLTGRQKQFVMLSWRIAFFFLCFSLLPVNASAAWRMLQKGLAVQEFPFEGTMHGLVIVRIDPAFNRFHLFQAREEGTTRTLGEWAKHKELDLAINASMYREDGLTSTGYMRQGNAVNNDRVMKRFGAFFVANPRDPLLPAADIVERDNPKLNDLLVQYEIVIQNFRLISADRKNLWIQKGQKNTVACVGKDAQGAILFIFCKVPSTPHDVAEKLLALPIDIRTTMYVEGGRQAGLFIAALEQDDASALPLYRFFSSVPNILGTRAIAPEANDPRPTDLRDSPDQ